MTTDKGTPVAEHWIDGNWCDSAEHSDSFDPATGWLAASSATASCTTKAARSPEPSRSNGGTLRLGRRSAPTRWGEPTSGVTCPLGCEVLSDRPWQRVRHGGLLLRRIGT